MAMLHTINKSPFEKNSMDACVRLAKDGGSVLFIEDGVYAATKGTTVADAISGAGGISFYVLGPDLSARGISEDKLLDGIKVVDYAGFVDLVADHAAVNPWL